MAVVKANGHGHGAIEVSKASLAAGASWLGVARVHEGLELVEAGIRAPILVLGPVTLQDIDAAIAHDLTLSLYSLEIAKVYARRSLELGKYLNVHIKIDTGMGRLGLFLDDLPELIDWISQEKGVQIQGIFSHFARADEPDFSFGKIQLERFCHAIEGINQAGIYPKWIHAANSAAAITQPLSRFNLVRVGAALYGLPPFPSMLLPSDFRPALSWKAQLVSCKVFPANCGIGYGHDYITKESEVIGVLPVGYADGWRRINGNVVLAAGQRAPIVGRICMDMSMLHLPCVLPTGTPVVIIGEQGENSIRVEEVASRWNTSSLDVVSTIGQRIPRFNIHNDNF